MRKDTLCIGSSKQVFWPSLVFENKKPLSVIHIGEYLRDIEFFREVEVGPNCKKYILECEDINKAELGDW